MNGDALLTEILLCGKMNIPETILLCSTDSNMGIPANISVTKIRRKSYFPFKKYLFSPKGYKLF
jgi:hypothetical protein